MRRCCLRVTPCPAGARTHTQARALPCTRTHTPAPPLCTPSGHAPSACTPDSEGTRSQQARPGPSPSPSPPPTDWPRASLSLPTSPARSHPTRSETPAAFQSARPGTPLVLGQPLPPVPPGLQPVLQGAWSAGQGRGPRSEPQGSEESLGCQETCAGQGGGLRLPEHRPAPPSSEG